MSEEEKKKIVSEPPPPTDEIDGEWGDDEQTLVREPPEGVLESRPAPSGAKLAGTSVAPISVPAKAAEAATPSEVKAARPVEVESAEEVEEEDEDEADEEPVTENEDDEEEDEDDEEDEVPHVVGKAEPHKSDWIPEWVPFAVLGLLVTGSILIGLGLIGGPANAPAESEKPATPAAAPATKPPGHP